MRRSLLILALLSAAFVAGGLAQEEQCTACAAQEQAKAALESQIAGLQTSLQTLTQERDYAQGSLATLTQERDYAQGSLATLTQERDNALGSLATLTRERDNALGFLATVQAQLSEALGSAQTAQAAAEASNAAADASRAAADASQAAADASQAEVQRLVTEAAAANEASKVTVEKWKKYSEDLKATSDNKIRDLDAALASGKGSSEKVAQLEAQLSQTQAANAARVRQLEESLASGAEINATVLMNAFKSFVEKNMKSFVEWSKLLYKEVQTGDYSRLQKLGADVVAYLQQVVEATFPFLEKTYKTAVLVVKTHLKSTTAFLSKQYGQKVPEEYKKKISEVLTKAADMWSLYVVDAVWAKQLMKHVNALNDELKAFLTTQLKQSPHTEFLADPVYIQLIVGGLMASPFMLALVPLLMMCVAPRKAEATTTTTKKKAKKSTKKTKAA
eukprot:gene23185-30397_t